MRKSEGKRMNHHRKGVVAASIALLMMCGVLTACSSSGDSDSGSANAKLDLAASEAALAKYKATPTSIPVSEPLKAAPEKGKTFVWMTCQLSACMDMGQSMKEAVTSLGWKYQEISYDQADPATLVSGMRKALRYDPAYVGMSGVAPETWATIVPEYKKAGVKIVASYLGKSDLDADVVLQVAGASLNEVQGDALAQWFIADSKGKGTALIQTVSDFPSNKIMSDTFVKTVKEDCPDCKVRQVSNSLADAGAGKIVPALVSELRSKPDYGYLVATYAPFLSGLPAALKSAGIADRVKVGGGYPDPVTMQAIKDGQFAVAPASSPHIAAYLMVDAAVRDETGTPQPKGGQQLDIQMLAKDVDFKVEASHDVPVDYAEQFQKLWGVSRG